MGKQEKLTWPTFVIVSAASVWLGWLLWTTWPDTEVFARYLLLLQVGIAFAIASAYRIVRYRFG